MVRKGFSETPCKRCGEPMLFIKGINGTPHPVNAKPRKVFVLAKEPFRDFGTWQLVDGFESHFSTCEYAGEFRKNSKKKNDNGPAGTAS